MKTLTIQSAAGKAELSSIIMGSTYFGTKLSKETVFSLLDDYFSFGGNCIDTARVYGQPDVGEASASEAVIGDYLKARTGLREKILLSTKGGHPPFHDMHSPRLDGDSLRADLEGSLQTLGTSYTDFYFLHRDDERIPVEQIMPVLDGFVKEGKVRFLGASNWKAARIAQANQYAKEQGLTPFSLSQIQWSLARTTPEQCGDDTLVCMTEEEYTWYRENQFPVLCYSSQAKGFFSKMIAQGPDALNDKAKARFLTEENMDKLEKVKTLSKKYGISPAAAVLLYLTHNEVPAAAIIGCSNAGQLADSMKDAGFIPDFPPFPFAF